MKKYRFWWLLLSLFFFSTASIAIQKTPAIIFKDLGRSMLLPVVGYPNGKPTLIFYAQLPSSDGNININFPKIYRTDNLSSVVTVEPDQFEDLSKTSNNIKDSFPLCQGQ